jgi:RHS repeat-associated protein
VAPGTSTTFNFNVTAPTTPGVYNFQWKMVRDGVQWFGALSANVAVGVNGTNDSQFISQTVPGIMSPAQSYPVSVTLQNTGTATWAPGSHFLGSENPEANTTWGLDRVDLTAQVAPGANVTLSFNVTTPSTAGTYNFQWRMVQNSTRFGGFTTNVSVNVQQAQAMALYFVHADHLNTPRLVADATGTTVWRWDQGEPFGNNPADENPSGLGAFDLPLRLPGQYFDAETGLHYNYFRDYDPSIGRYGESDPLGLAGGINTYAYVVSNPVASRDFFGLSFWSELWKRGGEQGAVKGAGAEFAGICAKTLCKRNFGQPASELDAFTECTGLLEDAKMMAQGRAYNVLKTCTDLCVTLTKDCRKDKSSCAPPSVTDVGNDV